ncbi:MAG: 50S ribosomal protein L31 [Planctomycetes bacterium]|nr:50S ribosomal protein L31 [Planctomycetota bacterium]NOG53467.1 50S ribosomal protein L31 [Planctomycetota bacterium]
MRDKIHPKWYPNCKVIYDGKEVMTTGATVPEIQVDVWSGSHPFYTGKSSFVDTAGRVDKFQRKFGSGMDYFKKGGGKKKG